MKRIEKAILIGGLSLVGLTAWLNPNGNGRVIQREKEKIYNDSITASYKKYSSGNELLILKDKDCVLCAYFKEDTLYNIHGRSTKAEGSPILDNYMSKDSVYSIRNCLRKQ